MNGKHVEEMNPEPTILVVDDDPDMRGYIKRCLKRIAIKVGEIHEASDGLEALERIRGGDVNLVISDVVMPRMDGFELCRVLGQDSRLQEIPILLVTGERLSRDVREHIGESPAIDVLTKPFNADKICTKVRQILSRAPPGPLKQEKPP